MSFAHRTPKIASQYPCIGHVRGCGLMMGIEIVDERQEADHMGSYPADGELAAAIQKACFDNKLLLERGGRGGNGRASFVSDYHHYRRV